MSVAFIFPGQGSQEEGMLHALPDHPDVAGTLKEASAILGRDVLDLDSHEALESTLHVQLALLIAGVSVSRALQSEGGGFRSGPEGSCAGFTFVYCQH
jgi:malonate decarboxylase epsilon subunit